jgi:ketosteroid isomerase-like protein
MTLDRPAFQAWLDRYVAAWKSYDPAAIGDLFAEDAEYRYHPQDEPLRGRDAIVADWLREADESGTYDARYEPLAIDGEVHVASGWSRYFDSEGTQRDGYSNIYLCRFDDDARCTSFTEWWIQDRVYARRAADAGDGATVDVATAPAADAGSSAA